MYAIIKDGTRQYQVSQGTMVKTEKRNNAPGSEIQFDNVLLLADGKDIKIGTPLIKGAKAIGKIIEHGKQKKVILVKFQRRKGYRKKQGHRQNYTLVKIEQIIH